MASRGMPKTTQVASFWAIGQRPGLTQFEQPACAVVAHAGHDDTGGEWAGGLGHRPEQDLDAGTVAADRRTVDQLDPVAAARSADQAVRVTGMIRARPGRIGS